MLAADTERTTWAVRQRLLALGRGRKPTYVGVCSAAHQILPLADTVMAAAVQAILPEQVEWPVVALEAVLASVGQLVDDAASGPAFASASRDFDESPLEQGHKPDSAHLYSDDSGSKRNESLHSEARGTSGLCILRYASITASYPHSVASPGIVHLRDDTSLHASIKGGAVVGDARPVDDRKLDDSERPLKHFSRFVAAAVLDLEEALVGRCPVVDPVEAVGSELAPVELPAAVVAP